jgi:hypothetical protein
MNITLKLIDGTEIEAEKGGIIKIDGVKLFSVINFTLNTNKGEQFKSGNDTLHIPLTSILWWGHSKQSK